MQSVKVSLVAIAVQPHPVCTDAVRPTHRVRWTRSCVFGRCPHTHGGKCTTSKLIAHLTWNDSANVNWGEHFELARVRGQRLHVRLQHRCCPTIPAHEIQTSLPTGDTTPLLQHPDGWMAVQPAKRKTRVSRHRQSDPAGQETTKVLTTPHPSGRKPRLPVREECLQGSALSAQWGDFERAEKVGRTNPTTNLEVPKQLSQTELTWWNEGRLYETSVTPKTPAPSFPVPEEKKPQNGDRQRINPCDRDHGHHRR